jgi:hypothetical protein
VLIAFPLSSFLRGGGILPLLVVLSHVDPLFLLDTHGYELLECPLVIHGVVVHLKSFEFLRERIKDQIDQKSSLIVKSRGFNLAATLLILRMISHTATGVLLRNEPLDERVGIFL